MKKNNRTILVCLNCVLLICLVLPRAEARDKITWLSDNLAPAFISQGPDKGEGIVDGVVEIYKQHLPDYDHEHLEATMPRILQLMQEGAKVCYAGFFRTPEREAFVKFSFPNLINYMGVLVVKKENRSLLFKDKETISLIDLLGDARFRLGLTKGRSYGKIIDDIIKAKGDRDKILYRSGQDSLEGLLEMLAANRIDYTIGFPWEFPYVAKQMGRQDRFGAVYIQEGKETRWIKNYLGCPKNEWGEKLIQKINRILIKVRPTEAHMHYQLKWFPKDIEESIRAACNTHILSVEK